MKNKILLICIIMLLLMLLIVGCVQETSDQINQNQVEANNKDLISQYPIPTLERSLERKNLIDRALVLNDDSKVFYVYLLSHDGKVVAFFTARSKVSSLNSYLNPQEKIVSYTNGVTIDSPDIDGSYGNNANAVFFFTTDGGYVEWSGLYLSSDQPLKVNSVVQLTRDIN